MVLLNQSSADEGMASGVQFDLPVRLNFEGMLLLLGVAYVQPHNRTQTVLNLAAEWAPDTIQVRAASESWAGDET